MSDERAALMEIVRLLQTAASEGVAEALAVARETLAATEEDIGPPLPGEWNEDEYPNPEIGMKC